MMMTMTIVYVHDDDVQNDINATITSQFDDYISYR